VDESISARHRQLCSRIFLQSSHLLCTLRPTLLPLSPSPSRHSVDRKATLQRWAILLRVYHSLSASLFIPSAALVLCQRVTRELLERVLESGYCNPQEFLALLPPCGTEEEDSCREILGYLKRLAKLSSSQQSN
jgi:hypothetical protein